MSGHPAPNDKGAGRSDRARWRGRGGGCLVIIGTQSYVGLTLDMVGAETESAFGQQLA